MIQFTVQILFGESTGVVERHDSCSSDRPAILGNENNFRTHNIDYTQTLQHQ